MYNRTVVGVTHYSAASCSGHGNTDAFTCANCTYGTGSTTTDCPVDPHSRKLTCVLTRNSNSRCQPRWLCELVC